MKPIPSGLDCSSCISLHARWKSPKIGQEKSCVACGATHKIMQVVPSVHILTTEPVSVNAVR